MSQQLLSGAPAVAPFGRNVVIVPLNVVINVVITNKKRGKIGDVSIFPEPSVRKIDVPPILYMISL